LEEHHLVKTTLAELEDLNSEDERFDAKVTVLIENVRHHIEEEESEMFAQARKAFSEDELQALGEEMQKAKQTAPRRPHPHAPDEPPANKMAMAASAPMDAVVRGTKNR
jgi:hemerythrin-like domain-containing protein